MGTCASKGDHLDRYFAILRSFTYEFRRLAGDDPVSVGADPEKFAKIQQARDKAYAQMQAAARAAFKRRDKQKKGALSKEDGQEVLASYFDLFAHYKEHYGITMYTCFAFTRAHRMLLAPARPCVPEVGACAMMLPTRPPAGRSSLPRCWLARKRLAGF